jgi:hypothetical protein
VQATNWDIFSNILFYLLMLHRGKPVDNPTIARCNASAVEIHNATSRVRFENVFSSTLKKRSKIVRIQERILIVNSEAVGLAPVQHIHSSLYPCCSCKQELILIPV